jgi:hypothetical protein
MSAIIITGSFAEIKAKLRRIKKIVELRMQQGYDPLSFEFNYRYDAFDDACGDCLPLNGTFYRGSYIVSEFEDSIQLNGVTWAVGKHRHCRCELTLINAREACIKMLTDELVNA